CGIFPLTGKLDACESLQENWYSLHSWASLLHVEKQRNMRVKTQSTEKSIARADITYFPSTMDRSSVSDTA
ncbi:hypothetical protein JG687_00004081, partial [Phytophthora cactorum]